MRRSWGTRAPARLAAIYLEAYKNATGEGLRHQEAHQAGLERVYELAIYHAGHRPLRSRLHQLIRKLEKTLRP